MSLFKLKYVLLWIRKNNIVKNSQECNEKIQALLTRLNYLLMNKDISRVNLFELSLHNANKDTKRLGVV